jgi:ferredoxin
MSVEVCFLPNDVTVTAEPGELILTVAARAGITITTGCLMGSCYACEVELDDGMPVRACITGIPRDRQKLTINLYSDEAW